nr:hypothetical protein [Tanacetum cinerariifolium]
ADVVLEEAKDATADAKDDQDEEESKPAELQKVVDIVSTAKIITEVGTAASTTITAADVLVPATTTAAAPKLAAAPSKGILVKEPKPLKKQAQIKQDEKYAREDNAAKRYQAIKRKPQTEAQARKNMMIYLKNVAGFKIEYFKGMSYDDIRPVFKRYFDSNVAFIQKTKEQKSRALKRINETPAEKATKRQKLEEEFEELKRHLQIVPNEDDNFYT